jgi:hypothetical protein
MSRLAKMVQHIFDPPDPNEERAFDTQKLTAIVAILLRPLDTSCLG